MDNIQELQFPADGSSVWAGMGDFQLVSPDGAHRLDLRYAGEPPHGDSYHSAAIDGRPFPGHVWGCQFAVTGDSHYLAFSWKPSGYERKTVVVDLLAQRYCVLPDYIYDYRFIWPVIHDSAKHDKGVSYHFTGEETWFTY